MGGYVIQVFELLVLTSFGEIDYRSRFELVVFDREESI